jgi:hypothetical protein
MEYNTALLNYLLSLLPAVQLQPLHRFFFLKFSSCAAQRTGITTQPVVNETYFSPVTQNVSVITSQYTFVSTTYLDTGHEASVVG